MIRTYFILFLISGCFLFACKPSGSTEVAAVTIDTPALGSVITESVSPTSFNPYGGYWISENYLAELKKSGSPRKAQEGSEEVLLILPDSTGKRSSLHYNFHEVNPELVLKNRNDTLWLDQKEGNDIMILPESPDKITINKKKFIRFNGSKQGNDLLILEPAFFAGKYKDENGNSIELDEKGYVRGFKNYLSYRIQLDYFDEGLQEDMIIWKAASARPDTMTFEIKNNVLLLYELKCKTRDKQTGICVEVKAGKKLHSLTKF